MGREDNYSMIDRPYSVATCFKGILEDISKEEETENIESKRNIARRARFHLMRYNEHLTEEERRRVNQTKYISSESLVPGTLGQFIPLIQQISEEWADASNAGQSEFKSAC